MGIAKISSGKPGSEFAEDGSGLCRYLLFASTRPEHTDGRNHGSAGARSYVWQGSLRWDFELQSYTNDRGSKNSPLAGCAVLDPPNEVFDVRPHTRARFAEGPGQRGGRR